MIMIRRKERRDGDPPTQFVPGELVRHRRYGYRGVVVALDEECRAPDEWYLRNQTQPRRDQPWYHVLVHGSGQTTYAAEENLELEHEPSPIVHPLLDRFFDGFADGGYVRNDRPWGT
jgi:heat shock protein HspQ